MARLLVYMLNVLRGKGGNMVFAATGDGREWRTRVAGLRRVFSAGPERVAAANPAYGEFLAERLLGYLEHWRVDHLVCGASGVGEGLCSWSGVLGQQG